jgi:hypothetical protein
LASLLDVLVDHYINVAMSVCDYRGGVVVDSLDGGLLSTIVPTITAVLCKRLVIVVAVVVVIVASESAAL